MKTYPFKLFNFMNFDRNRHPWIHSHHYSLERYHHSRKGTLASILHLLKTVDFWYAICYCRGVIYFPEFLYEQNPAACTHCMGVIHHSDFGCVDQCAIPLRRLVFSFFFFWLVFSCTVFCSSISLLMNIWSA